MPPIDPNLEQLERAAAVLAPLLDELTLVGGCATGLLIEDPAAASPRPTYDIDFVVDVVTYAGLQQLGKRLSKLGLQPAMEKGAPICRWRLGELRLDVMPIEEKILGFSNRWYRSALRHRISRTLPSGAGLHHIDAPHFLATKLEAYRSRGGGDAIASQDLEDLVRVVDGREALTWEVERAPAELQAFIAAGLRGCLADRYFVEALPGYFADLEDGLQRSRGTEQRLRTLAGHRG
jgi:hypothetical protein